jgi:hypothetical protein
MLKYSHPMLALILEYWPITIFAPTILLGIATLALITRWWDRRDQEARENLMPQAPATGVVVSWNSGRRNDPMKAGAPRVDPPFRGDGPGTRAAS